MASVSEGAVPHPRLLSLDAFRGAVIALMVLVNNGGGPASYAQLQHAKWNGWTLTDVVFPSFLWVAGISITLSLSKRMAAGVPKAMLFRAVVRRAVILFGLGLLLYLYPEFQWSTMRILGVLQRIAICYLVASAIFLVSGVRGQLFSTAALLAVYWGLMTLGTPRYELEGNFAHQVDRGVLGRHNYHGGDWDPEGIVSTIPAVATTLFGVLAGNLLRRTQPFARTLLRFAAIGVALVTAGLLWSRSMPINKKLWTDSFTLFMAGMDFAVFALFAWLIDGLQVRKPVKALVILGLNPIAIYVFSEWLASTLDWVDFHDWVYTNVFAKIASPLNASLLYAISFVGVTLLFAWVLHRRKWFWRI